MIRTNVRGKAWAAAVWSVLSPGRDPNVWGTQCIDSAYKMLCFLEVYSENSSLHRRLWRHNSRSWSPHQPRPADANLRSAAGAVSSPPPPPLSTPVCLCHVSPPGAAMVRVVFGSPVPTSRFSRRLLAFAESAARSQESRGAFPLSAFQELIEGWDSAPPGGSGRAFILGIRRLAIKDNRNAHRLFPVI